MLHIPGRIFFSIIAALSVTALQAKPLFDSAPTFADEESRQIAMQLLKAHGGMLPWQTAKSLQFQFFTKMINNPKPFYSKEYLDLNTGAALIDWQFFNSQVAWDTKQVWASNWKLPLSPGFFVRLTSSFITLPWQIHQQDMRVGPAGIGHLPEDVTPYTTLKVTMASPNPSMPGTFYEIFIDRKSGLMRGVRFDINHPGMVQNPDQPLGPNIHVFDEFRRMDGLVLPTFYHTFGQGNGSGTNTRAYHFVWDITLRKPFPDLTKIRPSHAEVDTISTKWWQQVEQP